MTPNRHSARFTPSATTAGAAALLALTSLSANAGIVSVSGLNQAVTGTVSTDVNGDGSIDFSLSNTATPIPNGWYLDAMLEMSAPGVGSGVVAPGTLIGPGLSMAPHTTLNSQTKTCTAGYGGYLPQCGAMSNTGVTGNNLLVPFTFAAGPDQKFGWVNLNVTEPAFSGQTFGVTLNGYAYDDGGNAVLAGNTTSPVPEPSSLLMLAVGFAGIAAFRRKAR